MPGFSRPDFEAVHASGVQVTSVRLNPAKHPDAFSLPFSGDVPWCRDGRYLSQRPSFTFDPIFHAGAYYVQEASSMFLWHALQTTITEPEGMKALDLCAAPGGKSTLAATYFEKGLVVSNEVIRARAAVLAENTAKWGTGNIIVTNNDPAHFQPFGDYFDAMIIDAPCSGSGLFRKDPDAVTEWSEANVELCSQRQQRILADSLPALKEGGLLYYSTCSYSQAENEDIADWLIREMNMDSVEIPVDTAWGIVATKSPEHGAHGYRFYPHRLNGEGFFMAVFRKKGSDASGRLKEQQLVMPAKQEMLQMADFMPLPDGHAYFKQAESIRAMPEQWLTDLKILAARLYIRRAGTEICSIKGKDVIPAHELALSLFPLGHFPALNLQKEDALQYLRRKEFSAEGVKGWNLVRCEGLPLGWVKVLPNRVNNYYPAEWRILKN